MVDQVDEHRQAEGVGEHDELLALLVGDVPGVGEERDACGPFLVREPDFAGEGVQVADERGDDLLEPGRRHAGMPVEYLLGEVRLRDGRDVRGHAAPSGCHLPLSLVHGRSLAQCGAAKPSTRAARTFPDTDPTAGQPDRVRFALEFSWVDVFD